MHLSSPTAGDLRAPRQRGGLESALAVGLVIIALAAAMAAMHLGGLPKPADAPAQAPAGRHPSLADARPALQGGTAPGVGQSLQPIHWDGRALTMNLHAVPLPQAIEGLAHATGSTVTGAESLAPASVTMRFRSHDLNAAWRQLLHGHAAVALSCTSSACRVWIGSEAATPNPAASSRKARADAPPDTRPVDMAPGEIESQPGGSC